MDVTDRVAIVTGSGRGIGRGIVLVLARHGADVVVADLAAAGAEAVAREVRALGRRSMASHLDVTDRESIQAMVAGVLERFGRIDILVNNAGVIGGPGWEDRQRWDSDDWDSTYQVNVKGVGMVTDAVAPHMRARRYGKIVNIASIAGRHSFSLNAPYAASKAAVMSLTRTTAMELAPDNINVNAICPGLLWTPMWEKIAYRRTVFEGSGETLTTREVFDRVVKERIPLGREQTPEDIGNLATFLASDAAMNITGQSINVSGGSHMS